MVLVCETSLGGSETQAIGVACKRRRGLCLCLFSAGEKDETARLDAEGEYILMTKCEEARGKRLEL